MKDILKNCELFEGLNEEELSSLAAIGNRRSLSDGEYLFLLGDNAERFYIVSRGNVELCFPLSLDGVIKDVRLELMSPGDVLGWSSLVKPYRFTLSARSSEEAEVVGFSRAALSRVFGSLPHSGYVFTRKLCEIIGHRLSNLHALWARELQRSLADSLGGGPEHSDPLASTSRSS